MPVMWKLPWQNGGISSRKSDLIFLSLPWGRKFWRPGTHSPSRTTTPNCSASPYGAASCPTRRRMRRCSQFLCNFLLVLRWNCSSTLELQYHVLMLWFVCVLCVVSRKCVRVVDFFQAGSMLALSRLPRDIGDRIGGECRRDVFRPVPRAGPVRPEEPANISATGIWGVGPHGGLRWTSASFGQLHVGLDGIVDSSLPRHESHRDAASHCGIEGPEQPRITGLHVRLSV